MSNITDNIQESVQSVMAETPINSAPNGAPSTTDATPPENTSKDLMHPAEPLSTDIHMLDNPSDPNYSETLRVDECTQDAPSDLNGVSHDLEEPRDGRPPEDLNPLPIHEDPNPPTPHEAPKEDAPGLETGAATALTATQELPAATEALAHSTAPAILPGAAAATVCSVDNETAEQYVFPVGSRKAGDQDLAEMIERFQGLLTNKTAALDSNLTILDSKLSNTSNQVSALDSALQMNDLVASQLIEMRGDQETQNIRSLALAGSLCVTGRVLSKLDGSVSKAALTYQAIASSYQACNTSSEELVGKCDELMKQLGTQCQVIAEMKSTKRQLHDQLLDMSKKAYQDAHAIIEDASKTSNEVVRSVLDTAAKRLEEAQTAITEERAAALEERAAALEERAAALEERVAAHKEREALYEQTLRQHERTWRQHDKNGKNYFMTVQPRSLLAREKN
jgi:hypothetical protein